MVQLRLCVMKSALPSIFAKALCKNTMLEYFVSTKRNHCKHAEQTQALRRSSPQPGTHLAQRLVMGRGREGLMLLLPRRGIK